jgi:tetratricopeptide (TPR) repeat protein
MIPTDRARNMMPSREVVSVPLTTIERVRALFEQGLCLQAYESARALEPMRAWSGTAARLLGGRLAINLGAPRLCRWLHLMAWRDDPTHLECCYYRGRQILDRNGPLAAWEFLQAIGEHPDADPAMRGTWFALHASVLARLRDFDAAEHWLTRADQSAPDKPWINIERSALLEAQDRYQEALAAARATLEMQAWYRPGVQRVAHVLLLMDREQEALDLLIEADRQIESSSVAAQLATLQTEMGRYADARRSYERFAALSPLMEKEIAQWLARRRADSVYFAGDFVEAARLAKEIEDPSYAELAKGLAENPDAGCRVLLPVGFVRQHHLTCAPATLAAIARY